MDQAHPISYLWVIRHVSRLLCATHGGLHVGKKGSFCPYRPYDLLGERETVS